MEQRFKRAERIERTLEWIRLKGHTILVTILTVFNMLILLPLAFFTWFSSLLGSYAFTWLYEISWGTFIFLWVLPYFTWNYSTITYPIKKGFKVKVDWSRTKKGRFFSLILNLGPFTIMSWAAATRYATEKYYPYLSSIHVAEERSGYYLTDDLGSLIMFINFAPVILTAILCFTLARHFQINKDILQDLFFTWEMPFLTRFTHTAEMDMCDVIIGYDKKTKKPIVIKEDQRYLHEGSFGATGSGKTSTSILLRIAQDLIKIATGRRKMGLIFLEPKGDGVDDVLMLCKKLGIPDEKIMVIDPTKSFSAKYNPFSGPMEAAAASFQGTLNALTGDQDEFFKGQQNEVAQTYTLLAKIRYGNLTNVTHIQRMFTDPRYLADIVEEVKHQVETRLEETDLDPDVHKTLISWGNIVRYFEDEILDFKTFRDKSDILPVLYPPDSRYAGKQVVENKKDKFVTGAKKYLNEIALNSMLSDLFVSEGDDMVFDADEFLKNGGVLLVNTALAELEELSLMFGQFFIRQLQSAVFRRPKEGRIPIYLYVDEFPLYVNEAFERFLTLGRSFKVGTLIAMQSLGQLDNVVAGFKETVLSNASSKTVFGRGTVADNKYFSEEFGEELVVEESLNESASPMTTEGNTWGFRMNTQRKFMPRFSPTKIRELPFKRMIVQVVDENNSITVSAEAVGKFVNEAAFLKPYLSVKKEEIKSTEEKEFRVETMIKPELISNINTASLKGKGSIKSFEVPQGQEGTVGEEQVEQATFVPDEVALFDKVPVPVTPPLQEIVPAAKSDSLFNTGIDFTIDKEVESDIDFSIDKVVEVEPVVDFAIDKEVDSTIDGASVVPVAPAESITEHASVPSDEINLHVDQLVASIRELPIDIESFPVEDIPVSAMEPPPEEEDGGFGGDFIDFNQLFPDDSNLPNEGESNVAQHEVLQPRLEQPVSQTLTDSKPNTNTKTPVGNQQQPMNKTPSMVIEIIDDDF